MAQDITSLVTGLLTKYPDPVSLQTAGKNQWAASGVDAAGNGSLPASSGDPVDLAYDGENRMLSGRTSASGTRSAEYDGEGYRVKRTVSGATIVYVYDAQGGLAQEYGAGSTASGRQYLIPDHLGSTRLMRSNSGTVRSRTDDFPFGQEIEADTTNRTAALGYQTKAAADADWQRVRFTGKERDAETGLDYFGARYFSAAQGRFTSPDWSEDPEPIPYADLGDPQTLNLYGYVRNNPLARNDPDGHFWHIVAGSGGGYLAGAGFELGRQWIKGENIDLQKVNAKGVNGAIFGGTVAATGGLGLLGTAGAYTAASVVGGATERAIDGDSRTKVLDKKAVTVDVLTGVATGLVGGAAKELAKDSIAATSKQATTRAESLLKQAVESGDPAKIAKREAQAGAAQQSINNQATAAAAVQRTVVKSPVGAVLKPKEEQQP
ncbi:RHS repeat-associated core domain-containing protein [Paludibaculum fermentans]|uniref:RHS repeat-associated core domain-containing protein n=1 Tax=Paludibaculum fermentans TaxID=1473598 RepID=UPI003EBAA760